MTAAPRYRPAHVPPREGAVFSMNTGTTRRDHGDWSMIMPDGTRKAWAGRGQQEEQGRS